MQERSRDRHRTGTAGPAALIAVLCLFAAGCASRELLLPKPAEIPSGLDLSGDWHLRGDAAAAEREIDRAARLTDGVDEREVMRQIRSGGGRPSGRGGPVAYLFIENAADLKITQAAHALFISFGRSVVEEYRYGELRIARIGQAAAQRSSGWEGDAYVIETLDDERMKVTDSYRLLDGRARLERLLVFRSRSMEEVPVRLVYERRAGD